MTKSPMPIREQTRAVIRSALARTAMELFAEKGYAETTIDEIAAAAGISRRTLFNYFRSKEDLALGGLAAQGEIIAERLAQRPPEEDVWTSLRAGFQILDEIEASPERRLEVVTLLFDNPSLRAGHAEKQAAWTALFAPLIEPHLPASAHRSLRARAIAATAITCLQTANEEWARQHGRADLFDLYDEAVNAVRGTV